MLDNAGMCHASPELNVPKVKFAEDVVMDGFGGKDIGMAVQEEAAVEPTVPNPTASQGQSGLSSLLLSTEGTPFFPETWVGYPPSHDSGEKQTLI